MTPFEMLDFDNYSKACLSKAIKEFSLSKMYEIPNLLSREYAITSIVE